MNSFIAKVLGGFLAFVLLVAAIVFMAAGSLNRVQSNRWGCLYGGGMFEEKGLKQTIAPGKSGGFTVWDKLVTLPSDDRIYAIDDDPATADFGGKKITVPAKGTNVDNTGIVSVVVPIQARFVINERACALYNDYLKKYGDDNLNFDGSDNPADPGGWARFLNLQMNQALIVATRRELAGKSYVELYTDFSQYIGFQNAISEALTASLRASLGDDFFCGPSYTFDGDADGQIAAGSCPPIEITLKEITPEDPQFLNNLKTIVANQEAQTVIQSNKDKQIAQTKADEETSIANTNAEKNKKTAQIEADKETQLAATAANRETELSQIAADTDTQKAQKAKELVIAQAILDLTKVQSQSDTIKAQAEAQFCIALAAVNVDCADYYRALNWKPEIITGDGGGVLINRT